MKIAILGFAGQGQSSYEYWNRDGNEITICDADEATEAADSVQTQLGTEYLANLDRFDLLVRTPALHPAVITKANPQSPDILAKVTSNTNEFFNVCPSKNIIGVTGTKGKGTTSTLIAKMLEAAGKKVHLGGNIGIPPLHLLKNNIEPDDYVVLELANFQLIDLKYSPPLAVCLMVQAEHLDWHKDIAEYLTAKQQLFRWQKPQDRAIYYALNENSKQIVSIGHGVKIPYFAEPGAIVENHNVKIGGKTICQTSELKLLGEHNWQNVCAALTAVWQVTQDVEALRNAVINFTGLPFRIEKLREVRGVTFYNDSFATAPEATEAAVNAIPGKKVLIMGGFDRGLSLEKIADALKKNEDDIQKVILVGNSAARLSEVMEAKGFSNYVQESSRNMGAIVARALEFAQNGDAVVLSPGFASFDMFKNFEDRGNKFNEAVEAL